MRRQFVLQEYAERNLPAVRSEGQRERETERGGRRGGGGGGIAVGFIKVDTAVEICIERDASRGTAKVGEDLIRRMDDNFQELDPEKLKADENHVRRMQASEI